MNRQLMAVILLACLSTMSYSVFATDPAPGDTEVPPEPVMQVTAADRLELDSTSIRGNQELPKVLYIVPWKDPALGDLVGKPVNSLVDEVLSPVDRELFRRQTDYFDQLYGDES